MKNKKININIPEHIAIERLKKYIDECDGDELARLLGDFFGGQCYQSYNDPSTYDFTLNEFYSGEFNDLIKE